MGLFGFSLSNLFGKTVKHSSHKHHSPATKTHRRKPSNKRASKKMVAVLANIKCVVDEVEQPNHLSFLL